MPSMKAVKRRITSVKNTKQIMKAMNLVAASKVQKFKNRMEAVSPMFTSAKDFIQNGINDDDVKGNIYFASRPEEEVKRTAYVVIAGERGLCGSYNANVFKTALAHMQSKSGESIIAVGARCKDHFVRRDKNVVANYAGVLENVPFSVAEEVAQSLVDMYTSKDPDKRVDEVYIAYTHFETLLSQTPEIVKILPFTVSAKTSERKEITYEPDLDTYLRKSVPQYLAMFIFGAMIESSVCEQASRMTSMDAAARNADELVEKLTLQYNRQRQSAITQEISEIVGGANAI